MTEKILIVDDEADLELLITQKFRKEIRAGEVSFAYACNGIDALTALDQHPEIDIVFTDLNMPEMDGLTLLTKIRHKKPTLRTIVVSAYGDMGNIRAAMNQGAFDFITKPIDFGDLRITLDKTRESVSELKEIEQARREKEEARQHAFQQEREAKEAKQKLIDQLKRMDRLKDEFLANTTHELKTPLNGIIGIVDSLLDGATGELPEETRFNLQMVSSSGQRLSRLVDEILDFSKLKAGGVVGKNQAVDLEAMVDMVITLSRPLIGEKAIELQNGISSNCPLAFADTNRVQQILFNLVGNAIKFTESGTVAVTAASQDGMLAITVSDTGIGIPEERFEDIFKMFEQLAPSATRSQGGTGLGLAITKELVTLNGGTIKVNSQQGVGSQFTFTLPLADASLERPAKPLTPIKKLKKSRSRPDLSRMVREFKSREGLRILLVDDEPVNLQVLINQLSRLNYQLTTANSGPEALQHLEKQSFDLVILDVMMPGMSGIEVCQNLRQNHGLHDLPVLMLTAKNQIADLAAGLEAGANDYLTKPFDKRELLARVQTLLTLKEAVSAALRHQDHLTRERERARILEGEKSQLQTLAEASAKAEAEARRTVQDKSDLLAMMSHELRTPLNAIIGYSEILLEDLELDSQTGYIPDLLKIQSSAQNLLSLINNLLDLSKIEAGKMEIYVETFRLAALFQEISITIEPLVERNHNSFEIIQPEDMPLISSDVTKLRIIFTNLLGNACKFTRQGKIQIQIALHPDSFEVSVSDTGIGMTEEQITRIFQPFTQAEKTTFRHHGGSGLGLMITKRFCEMLGGDIQVTSKLGSGSTFCVRLPIVGPEGLVVRPEET